MREDRISDGPPSRPRVIVTVGEDAVHLEPRVITVNKRTHRIRFENETESEVILVIEPK